MFFILRTYLRGGGGIAYLHFSKLHKFLEYYFYHSLDILEAVSKRIKILNIFFTHLAKKTCRTSLKMFINTGVFKLAQFVCWEVGSLDSGEELAGK